MVGSLYKKWNEDGPNFCRNVLNLVLDGQLLIHKNDKRNESKNNSVLNLVLDGQLLILRSTY